MKGIGCIAIAVCGACLGGLAHAQQNAVPIAFGGKGWDGADVAAASPKDDSGALHFSIKAGAATDYIYRGTTLSDHKPAVGSIVEVTYGQFYAWTSVATVRLPSKPDAELGLSGGIRPSFAGIDFDLGVTYFAYPGEALPGNGINYWEAALRADYRISESWRIAGGFAYSPNVSNTGAWSWYAAAGLGYDVPAQFLPADLGVSITAAAGYSWFGRQSAALGGFALPAYLNWQIGTTFTYKLVSVDLRYYDSNLSREDCFVFTGDPNAVPGGAVNPVTNPGGLRSNWCGAAFVAKLSIGLDDTMLKQTAQH
jgi:uncharacterized protein (TIGR02001 family)